MDRTVIDNAIHKVPNFPKQGVLFYDITGILSNTDVFKQIVDYYCERYKHKHIDAIAAIDSRGFIFGAPVAYTLGIPLILVRKKGKLPRATVKKEFSLEYGTDMIEVHTEDIPKNGNIILFDDLLATGGTAYAAASLLTEHSAKVLEIASIIALDFLPYAEVLKAYPFHYLISYNTEKMEE